MSERTESRWCEKCNRNTYQLVNGFGRSFWCYGDMGTVEHRLYGPEEARAWREKEAKKEKGS